MTGKTRFILGLSIAALMVVVPWRYGVRQYRHYRNFAVVHEGVLYRSAQLDVPGLKRVVHDHKIKTIISLRDGKSASEQAEEAFCKQSGVNFVRIEPLVFAEEDVTERGMNQVRALLADPVKLPALIHCFAGIHRTGQVCAIYRIDHGWSNEKALEEMIHRGYSIIRQNQHSNVLRYLENYKPEVRSEGRLTPANLTSKKQP